MIGGTLNLKRYVSYHADENTALTALFASIRGSTMSGPPPVRHFPVRTGEV